MKTPLFFFIYASLLWSQESITGPWNWIALPYDGYCSDEHLDKDFIAKNSKGTLTEEKLIKDAARPGDKVGSFSWEPSVILSDRSDNLHEMFIRTGKLKTKVWGYAAYGVIVIQSDKVQNSVTMRVGSDDGIKVWMNGELVHKNNVRRGSTGYQDESKINIKQGANLLVVKIFQCTEEWAFYAGIQAEFTASGKKYKRSSQPVSGLTNFSAQSIAGMAGDFVRKKKYDEAIPLLQRADSMASDDPKVLHLISDAYWDMQDYATTVSFCEREEVLWQNLMLKAISKDDKRDIANGQLTMYGKWARSLVMLGQAEDALSVAEKGYTIDSKTDNFNLAMAKTEALMTMAEGYLLKEEYNAVEPLLQQCESAAIKNAYYFEKYFNGWQFYPQMIEFMRKRCALGKVQPSHIHHILVLYVSDVDADIERNGKKIHVHNVMTDALKQSAFREQEILKRWYEAYSGGQFSLEFERVDVGGVTSLRPNNGLDYFETEDIHPSVAPLLYQYRNFDTYAVYWNGKDVHNTGRGGAWTHAYFPEILDQPVIRAGMLITKNDVHDYWPMPGLLLHEFGHVIETMSNLGFVHCQDERKKNSYPGWDGDCDNLYRWVMKNYLPDKWDQLNWAVKFPDTTTEEAFQKAEQEYKSLEPGRTLKLRTYKNSGADESGQKLKPTKPVESPHH